MISGWFWYWLFNKTFWKVVCVGCPVVSRCRSSHRSSPKVLASGSSNTKRYLSNVGESGVISIVGGIILGILFRSDIIVWCNWLVVAAGISSSTAGSLTTASVCRCSASNLFLNLRQCWWCQIRIISLTIQWNDCFSSYFWGRLWWGWGLFYYYSFQGNVLVLLFFDYYWVPKNPTMNSNWV